MTLAGKVAVNASAMAAGRLATAATGIVGVGITTRYLGVDAFGALAVGVAFVSIVGVVTDIGIWNVGMREIAKRPEETQRILGALLTVGLALAMVAVVIGVLMSNLIYGGGDDGLVRRAVLLLLITVPLAAPAGAINAYFLARQQAYVGVATGVFGSVFLFGMLLAVTALDLGFTGIVLAYASSGVAQTALLVVFAAGKVRLRPSVDLRLSGRVLKLALPLGGSMLVGSLYWRIDVILLSVLASRSEVAHYGFSYRIVDALVLLPSIVTVTLLPEFARLAERRARFDQLVQKAFTVMQVAALAVFVPFVVFANEITGLVGGSGFGGAAPVLQLLMVGVALNYLTAIFPQALFALNGQSKLFILSVVLLPANVALNLALIPVWGASGAALAFGLTEVIHLTMIVALYRGFATPPRPWRGVRVLAAGCAMAAAGLVKLLPVTGNGGLVLTLLLGGTVSLALYVGALYALKAMPREVHTNLVLPLWARLKPPLLAGAKSR